MITLKLNDYNEMHTILWQSYADMGFSTIQNGYKGFRDYIEKSYPEIKTSGSVAEGIDLHFEDENEATMFILRWA